jgi:hypothetical protein
VSGERKREGDSGPAQEKGPAQGGKGRQVGLPSLISFPFSFLLLLKLKSI